MIIENRGEYDLGVWFTHLRGGGWKTGTDCYIYAGDAGSRLNENGPVSNGRSFLNPKDKNFNKAVGRHVSFFNALENSPLTKEDKAALVAKVRASCNLVDPKHVK